MGTVIVETKYQGKVKEKGSSLPHGESVVASRLYKMPGVV